MVESLQMFLFLFKSKYRRKCSWFSPFLCSVLIVLLFCHNVLSICNELNCSNGWCKNGTCECYEGWQGSECQYCGGKIKLNATSGIITDGPGNYSVSVQCSWLIAPPWTGPRPPPIRIRLENFATECGWDHLYVYDGDSVRASKLLAVFSGLIGDEESSWTRQVVARSGNALLHFFSDDAYAMEGFNVTYAAYSCPSDAHHTNCSNHGICDEGTCKCDRGWAGIACDQIDCPEECLSQSWSGSCSCSEGEDGGARWRRGWGEWGEVGGRSDVTPTAGHVLLTLGGDVVAVGGETYGGGHLLYRYKTSDKSWSPIETRNQPLSRFGHSAVMYGSDVIMYGGVVATDDPEKSGGLAGVEGRFGVVSNEIWRVSLSLSTPVWTDLTPQCAHTAHTHTQCGGLHVSGHTAVLVNLGPLKKPVMLVFFGHSPHYGYLHVVQEYYIEENKWSVAATRGWSARGGFGHTAQWDPLSGKVYLHGGLVSLSEATQAPSSGLAEYDVENRIWKYLSSAPTPRYLHSATFISPGMMLVFGGNAHNDTAAVSSNPNSAKCFSGDPLLYDVRCGRWHSIPPPVGVSRAAHAAVLLPRQDAPTVLIQGGFDGRLRSDALLFVSGASCDSVSTELECLDHGQKAARPCVWRYQDNKCVALEEIGWLESFEDHVKACTEEPTLPSGRCELGDSCMSCTGLGCVWCGACHPTSAHCAPHRRQVAVAVDECGSGWEAVREGCGGLHSCAACHHHRHNHHLVDAGNEDVGPRVCYWDYDTVKCKPANVTDDIRSVSGGSGCPAPCSTYETCGNCTAEECIWCASAARCVDKNAYAASFPLGGCRVWATSGGSHVCDLHAPCHLHHNCHHCRSEPACGWCAEEGGGGRGACMSGGAAGPHTPHSCHRTRWFFTTCPWCQCNGHSVCLESEEESSEEDLGAGGGRCVRPCAGRTVGDHCDQCAPGHWGSPANGGTCQPCECNAMAVSCSGDSGRCHCSTKGLTGDRCDKCDVTNHYHPDHYNKGACYYDLAVDYQFTFNLSKKEDRHLSAINFRNSPLKADVDADFTIMCSSHARMNVTVRTRAEPKEKPLFNDLNCTNFRYKFSKSEHQFGVEDNVTLSTFFVYVYDFKPPLWIQISFSQYPKLNLQQFFITFSSCFLLLLLVAAALWKIKQRYDMYRRRQRLFVEMEQMASRAFSQVCVELDKGGGEGGIPAPVALEPCAGGRAAVLSLVVRLPTGGTGRAPPLGGLAVASALVTLGHTTQTTTKRHRN